MIREEVLEVWKELKLELNKCRHKCIRFYCPRPGGKPEPEITCWYCRENLTFIEEVD